MVKTIIFKHGLKEHLSKIDYRVGEALYCEDTNELYVGTKDGPVLLCRDGGLIKTFLARDNNGKWYISITPPIPCDCWWCRWVRSLTTK